MQGFDDFVHHHERRLVRLCWLLTLDHGDAADVVQETFLRWWNAREELQHHPDLDAWLRRVAVNLCRDRQRRRLVRRRKNHLVLADDTTNDVSPEFDLHRAIAQLPQRQREAIVLRYWGDLDLEGCAAAMGVGVGSVKTHLTRAHTALGASSHLSREETS